MRSCVIIPDKPRLKRLGSRFIFDPSVLPQCSHLGGEKTCVGEVLTDDWRGPRASYDPLTSKKINVGRTRGTNCCLARVGIHLCGSKRFAPQHNATCVVEGVTATRARGDPAAESLRATQEELSPAEERLSSCPGLHLCRLACLSAHLTGEERGALGGFGREWEPTSHLAL